MKLRHWKNPTGRTAFSAMLSQVRRRCKQRNADSQRFFSPGRPETVPRYANKRPQVMAPTQQTSERKPRRFAIGETGDSSSLGLPNTFLRIAARIATPPKTKTILM